MTLYTPERHYLDFENFSGHGLIAVCCLLDVAVSDRPWRLTHVLHPVLFGGLFGAFSLIYFLCGGTNYYFEPYIYIILDWSRPMRYIYSVHDNHSRISYSRTILIVTATSFGLVVLHCFFFLCFKLRTFTKRHLIQNN